MTFESRHPRTLLFAFVLGLAASCTTESPQDWATAKIEPRALFEETTAAAGIRYVGGSNGASWGDFDGDGLPDIWSSGHSPCHLYRNRGDGTFENVCAQVLTIPDSDRHGAAWADVDNDGDADVMQMNGAGRGQGMGSVNLFVQSASRLTDEASARGIEDPLGRGRTPVWLDVDGDGRLDVVLNHAHRDDAPTALFEQAGPPGFRDATADAGLSVMGSEFALLGHLNGSGPMDLLLGMPFPHKVYELTGQRLRDITATLAIPEQELVTDAALVDLNNDLLPDLFTVRGDLASGVDADGDRTLRVRLRASGNTQEIEFRTTGTVSFEIAPFATDWWKRDDLFVGAAGKHPDGMPFSLSTGDAENRGLSATALEQPKSISVGHDPEHESWHLRLAATKWEQVLAIVRSDAAISDVVRHGFTEQAAGPPRMFVNRKGSFAESALRFDLTAADNCYSVAAGDFDNDMDVDLYLVCGSSVANTANVLLENRGDGTLRMIPGAGGAAGSSRGIGDSVAVADYDRDGFLDLFVTNGRDVVPLCDGPHQLFHNRGNANHWLELDLRGTASNRDGIGARVVVTTGGVSQLRTQDNGMHDRAQNFRRLHFGLGPNASADDVVVEWPSGRVQRLTDVRADQVLVVVEEGPVRPAAPPPSDAAAPRASVSPGAGESARQRE
jgi:hypothetical protein